MKRETLDLLKMYLSGGRSLKDAMDRNVAVDPTNIWKHTGYKQYMTKYVAIAKSVAQLTRITAPVDVWDLDKVPGSQSLNAFQQREYWEAVYANLVLLIAFLDHVVGLKADEIQNLRDFLQANLRRAVLRQPDNEKDIQDVVEQLLIGRGLARGVDYDREVGRVRVSIKEVIPDFIFPRLSLAVEVKLCKNQQKSRDIVDEINADIQAYGKTYSALLFIVYDLGAIRDEAAFKNGLETHDGYVQVIVVKH